MSPDQTSMKSVTKSKSKNTNTVNKTVNKTVSKKALASEIIRQSLYMKQKGLTPGHSGNISARYKDGFLITPTGVPYDDLKPEHIVFVKSLKQEQPRNDQNLNNENAQLWDPKGLKPSSEWQFHRAAYQANKEVEALVHTHSNYATILACAGEEIPPFHYMVAAAGVDTIPLVPYAIFGSTQLSEGVKTAFKNSKACLLAHHGQLAGEKSLAKAMELSEIIEDLSLQYWGLLQLGKVKLLTKSQMKAVHAKFSTYGQQNDQ